jgi:hypothetical protein
MTTMTDDELNRAIDAVARDMVGAEPPVSLRASILARIEGDTRGRGLGFPRWAWAAAGTAVIAVAVGTWLAMPTHQPQPEGSFVSVTAPAAPPPAVSSGEPPLAMPVQVAARTQTPVAARLRNPVPRPEHGLAWEAGPEPLAEPAPIAIDALGPDSLEIPEIHIAPIADIEPITIPAAGPGLPEPQRRDSR